MGLLPKADAEGSISLVDRTAGSEKLTEYAILWKPPARRPERQVGHLGATDAPSNPESRVSIQTLDAHEAREAALSPEVARVAPAMRMKLIAPLSSSSGGTSSWGLEAVGALSSPFTGEGIKVAVLDTGIDAHHEAFAGMTLIEEDFTGDGNGDKCGHGTHCAGTIFGRDVGGERIGVARGVQTALIGKVLDHNGDGTSLMTIKALMWAIQERAHVISMSLGFDFPGQVKELVDDNWPADLATSVTLESYRQNLLMFQEIADLAKKFGSFGGSPLLVAASGNESKRDVGPRYRIAASLPATVCDVSVAAVKRDKAGLSVADFSNSNPTLSAPGVSISSASIGGGLCTKSGTSMACPHVAGVAALWADKLRKKDGECSGQTIFSHLIATARTDQIIGYNKSSIVDVGHGVIQSP